MQEHFRFSDKQMANLATKKICMTDLYKFAKNFDPSGNMLEIGKMNLYAYIDKKGDFMEGPSFKTKHICMEIFENLDVMDKCEIAEYIDYLENGEDDEED